MIVPVIFQQCSCSFSLHRTASQDTNLLFWEGRKKKKDFSWGLCCQQNKILVKIFSCSWLDAEFFSTLAHFYHFISKAPSFSRFSTLAVLVVIPRDMSITVNRVHTWSFLILAESPPISNHSLILCQAVQYCTWPLDFINSISHYSSIWYSACHCWVINYGKYVEYITDFAMTKKEQ